MEKPGTALWYRRGPVLPPVGSTDLMPSPGRPPPEDGHLDEVSPQEDHRANRDRERRFATHLRTARSHPPWAELKLGAPKRKARPPRPTGARGRSQAAGPARSGPRAPRARAETDRRAPQKLWPGARAYGSARRAAPQGGRP